MKQIIISFFILFLVACQADTARYSLETKDRVSVVRQKLFDRDMSSVLVVAHRGDWRNFPENSIAAIESAIEMGADVVEVDVQRTKDGVLILMHDQTLNRTTTGRGRVDETTWEEIQKLYLRNGAAIRTMHKVPSLEEALLYSRDRVMLNLDKADRFFDQVYDLLVETGTTHQIIMKGTRSIEQVYELYGDYLDDVIYMPIVNLDRENSLEQIKRFMNEMNPVAFELLYECDSNPLPRKVSSILYGHSLIWYNTLWDTMAGGHDDDLSLKDPDLGYGYLIDSLDARIIQTDRPAFLIDYLRSKGLHEALSIQK